MLMFYLICSCINIDNIYTCFFSAVIFNVKITNLSYSSPYWYFVLHISIFFINLKNNQFSRIAIDVDISK